MGKEQFIGVWKLISYDYKHLNGNVTYPLGNNAVGSLIYTATGHMSVQCMKIDRPKFAISDQFHGNPAEIKAAFEGYLAYYGTYEISEKEGTVVHHIEGSWFPNRVNTSLLRFFEISGNRLLLRTPEITVADLGTVISTLLWERVE